jgi:RND superfamily putative drug exporter
MLALWLAAILGAAPMAPRVFGLLQPGGLSSSTAESVQASQLLERQLGYNPAAVVVVFTSDRLTLDDPRWGEAEEQALASVRQLPDVAEVTTGSERPRQAAVDRQASYATIALRSQPEHFRDSLPRIRAALQPTELEAVVTGAPVFYADILEVTERDLRRAELISLPFAILAMLFVFGSVVAAAVPGLVGGAAVLVTVSLVVLLAQLFPLSVFALNLVTMLGLGLGIDYALFIVSRFREELAGGRPTEIAVAVAVATAGQSVLFSGLTVFVGLLGLSSFDYLALRSMGLAGSLVVLLSLLAALTMLPALLSVLGPRINALSVWRPGRGGSFWASLAQRVMRRPGAVFLAVLLLLGGLGLPFLRVELGAPDASVLPPDVQSRRGFDLLRDHFGQGEQSPILITVSSPGSIFSRGSVDALLDYVAELQRDPRVSRVESIVTLDPRISRDQYHLIYGPAAASGRVESVAEPFARQVALETSRPGFTLIRVTSRHSQTAPESKDLLQRVRSLPIGAGLTTLVGGGTAGVVDYAEGLYRDFPRVLAFIVLSTYVILFALLRSALLPLKAIVMNTLSLLASYGALVIIFQEGWLAGLTRVEPLGFVEASLPIVLFCVLFGLSMDYEVFLLARVKEAYDQGADNETSVALGLERSGRIITSAALIIVLVSASFAVADIVLIKALGIGTAIAVFLDATIVRALLVPATMRLLGEWNWWAPRGVLRRLPAWQAER